MVHIVEDEGSGFIRLQGAPRKSGKRIRLEGNPARITVPKTLELNGLAERMNRSIKKRVRSMLAHAKLPKTFWAEALSRTTYVINRSPSVPLDGDTP